MRSNHSNNGARQSVNSKILPAFCIPGRSLREVGGVIVHYFSGKNVDPERRFDMEVCRNLFVDLNRPRADREHYMLDEGWPQKRMYASAHLLIGREGQIWRLVEYDMQAFHAGTSQLHGRRGCNQWTLGIELVGDNQSGFSREQYVALAEVLLDLEEEYGFEREFIAGHDQVRHAAIEDGAQASKKYDPSGRSDGRGDNFDWWYLGKLMNDRKPNPRGVVGIEALDEVLAADPLSG